MAIISPCGKEGMLRALYGEGNGDDEHKASVYRQPYEGEVNLMGEIYHNGKWCTIIDRIGNFYKIKEK